MCCAVVSLLRCWGTHNTLDNDGRWHYTRTILSILPLGTGFPQTGLLAALLLTTARQHSTYQADRDVGDPDHCIHCIHCPPSPSLVQYQHDTRHLCDPVPGSLAAGCCILLLCHCGGCGAGGWGEDITSKLAADIRYHQLPVNCCKLDAIRYRPFE